MNPKESRQKVKIEQPGNVLCSTHFDAVTRVVKGLDLLAARIVGDRTLHGQLMIQVFQRFKYACIRGMPSVLQRGSNQSCCQRTGSIAAETSAVTETATFPLASP